MTAANMGIKAAQLYSYQTLDGLVELIEVVSQDFRRNRPDRYRYLDQDAHVQLSRFDRVGACADYPDRDTRARYFEAYLGDQFSPRAHPVLEHAKSLRKRAAHHVEYEQADPNSGHHCLECVRSAAKDLLRVLTQLTTDTAPQFARVHASTSAIFRTTANIMRNASFAAAFGVHEIRDESWPETHYNRQGGILVRQIMAIVKSNSAEVGGLTGLGKSQLQHFKAFQDCAIYGAKTITMVSEKKWNSGKDGALVDLSNMAARWHAATLKLPGKVDQRRFTIADVIEIIEQTNPIGHRVKPSLKEIA